jgi:hypothetical protein
MSATTSEGTGLGSVENIVPKIYSHQIRREILRIKEIVKEPPANIDGGELKMLKALSDEDIKIILKAAEILKGIQ